MFPNISIYLYMYTYILWVCARGRHTNTAVLHWLFPFSVKDTRFQSLKLLGRGHR